MSRFLAGRAAPALFGLASSLLYGWIWGSLDAVPTVHDEAAYVLQAQLFAAASWTAPAPPYPEFFEQIHVFVTPFLASKYPPGHSFVLVPGVWLGLPGLMPLVLSGAAGALVFLLARRLANPWVALLAWFVWTTAPGDLFFRTSYMSEMTTTALLLAAWWALLEWRRTLRRSWLLAVAGCMAWSAITRPFSTLALLLPIGAVVLWTGWKRSRWRDVLLAAAFGGVILLVVPIWSAATTGDWRTTPYALYSRIYFPYQRPGFGAPQTGSLRPLPPDAVAYAAEFEQLHRSHSLENLPRIVTRRLGALARHMWGGWRLPLIFFAAVGLFALSAETAFGVASALALFLQYLLLAHFRGWTVYYLEIQPVLAFLTALGLWRFSAAAGRRLKPGSPRFAEALVLVIVFVGFAPAAIDAARMRGIKRSEARSQERFRELVRALSEPAIVFVRYAPNHNPHRSLVVNDPDLAAARVWVVYDRGSDNGRLLRTAPGRRPYLYDEATESLSPLPPPL